MEIKIWQKITQNCDADRTKKVNPVNKRILNSIKSITRQSSRSCTIFFCRKFTIMYVAVYAFTTVFHYSNKTPWFEKRCWKINKSPNYSLHQATTPKEFHTKLKHPKHPSTKQKFMKKDIFSHCSSGSGGITGYFISLFFKRIVSVFINVFQSFRRFLKTSKNRIFSKID